MVVEGSASFTCSFIHPTNIEHLLGAKHYIGHEQIKNLIAILIQIITSYLSEDLIDCHFLSILQIQKLTLRN